MLRELGPRRRPRRQRRRASPRGGRALRPDRQDLPRHGARSGRRSAGRWRSTRWSRPRSSSPAYGLRTAGVEVVARARARPAAGLGRRRPAAPGAAQPDRQRAAGAAAGAGRRAGSRSAPTRDGRRSCARGRRTTGPGMPPEVQKRDLRAVLHHQAAGRGHRRRALGLPRHRRRARRPDRGRERAGPGHAAPRSRCRCGAAVPAARPADGGRRPSRPPRPRAGGRRRARRSRELVAEHAAAGRARRSRRSRAGGRRWPASPAAGSTSW